MAKHDRIKSDIKAKDRERHILKQKKKLSSGRITKPPKYVMSTSSSDQENNRKLLNISQPAVNMRSEIDELRFDTQKHSFLAQNLQVQYVKGPLDKSLENVIETAPISNESSEQLAIQKSLQPASSTNDGFIPMVVVADIQRYTSDSQRITLPTTREKHYVVDEQNASNPSSNSADHGIAANHNVLNELKIIEQQINALVSNTAELHKQIAGLYEQNQNVIIEITSMKKEMTSLKAELTSLNMPNEDELDKSILQPLENFPLSSLSKFEELESEDGKQKRRLYNHIQKMGAFSVRSFLNIAIKEILTDQLVYRFTWNGKAGTRAFKSTKLSNIFYTAARKCQNFKGPNDKATFIVHMKEIIRVTKQRYRNSLQKMQSVKNNQSEGDRAQAGMDARNDLDENERQNSINRNDSQSGHRSNSNESSDGDEKSSGEFNEYEDSDIDIFSSDNDENERENVRIILQE